MATVLESTPSIYNVPLRGGHLERWSTPPENSDVSAERLHRKQRLAAAFRVFARYGFDMGGAGHITVRDPENTEHFWVNPHGVWFGHIRVSDLLRVDSNGQVIEGKGALNKAAFVIHKAIHDARPDVVAAAHAHAFHGKVWSTTGRLLGPLTQDATAFYESHALYNSYSGVVLDSDEGQRIASSLGLNKALLLSNHGHLTVGKTVESAVW